jgi:RND family efflux transporter MFP subunit
MSEERHSPLALHPVEAGESGELLKRGQVVRRAKIAAVIVLVLLAIGAGRTVISRVYNGKELEAGATERNKNYVKTTLAKASESGQTLALPGTLQGFVQSPIYARAGGYVKRWTKDIGARVSKGELLAEIETPEIDQQLSQAVAARQQASASLDLAQSTAVRWEALRKKDAVSQQEVDERRSASAQAGANLAAADANVQRLRQLENFKRIIAPTDGIITRRNVDTGDLIDAGAGGGLARALFVVTQTDPLRLYVNVPQTYAQLVKTGQSVVVTQAELRGQKFQGQVARTAASIDATSRSMQVEISLPNTAGTLLPGAFVQVSLPLAASRGLAIPNNALIIRGDGIKVAAIDAQGRVHLKPVQLGRNYGERGSGRRRGQRRTPGAQPLGFAGRGRPGVLQRRRGRQGRRQGRQEAGRGRGRRRQSQSRTRESRAVNRLNTTGTLFGGAGRGRAGRLHGRPGLPQARGRHARGLAGRGALAHRHPQRPGCQGPLVGAFWRPAAQCPGAKSHGRQPDAGRRQCAPGAGARQPGGQFGQPVPAGRPGLRAPRGRRFRRTGR